MNKTVYPLATLTHRVGLAFFVVLATVLLTACHGNSGKMSISGRLLGMNQATFYLYSPDGAIEGIDTMQVKGGRFEYEKEIIHEGIIAVVYPNFSQIPIYVRPGDDISIDGAASAISQQEISGNDDNDLFTEWRKENLHTAGKELRKAAQQYITEHPESPLGVWMVRQYFLFDAEPDLAAARRLLDNICKAQPENAYALALKTQTDNMPACGEGNKLPRFTATDINGQTVTDHQLNHGRTVICVWATWNYDGQNMLRQLASRKRQVGAGVSPDDGLTPDHVVTVCLDGSRKECRRTLHNCNAEELTTINDSLQWDSPVAKALGLYTVPDNLLIVDGKIVKRHVPTGELFK